MRCKNCNSPTPNKGDYFKKYCNISCQREYESKVSKKHYDDKPCKYCGNIFTPVSLTNMFCSRLCSNRSQGLKRYKKPKIKNCSHCNKEFTPYTSLDKYCSGICRIENMKSSRNRSGKRWNEVSIKNRMGKNNPAYVHGNAVLGAKKSAIGMRLFFKNRNEYKRSLIEKNGYLCCEKCGTTSTKLEAHHIVYRSEKPLHEHLHSKDNIIMVCVKCHNWFHKSKSNRNELVVDRKLNILFGDDILDKQIKAQEHA